MKILIIGGNRFFGKKLAQRLVQSQHKVTLLNRGQTDDGLIGKKITEWMPKVLGALVNRG